MFSKERFDYVRSKPLHLSQKININERTVIIEVIPNKELESLILGFGDDVEILEPENLRIVIKARIEKMNKIHESV